MEITRVVIESLAELRRHEPAILQRISRHPRGAELYLVHPLCLLAEVGVELSPSVVRELKQLVPGLSSLSALTYQAVKDAPASRMTIHVRRLFPEGRV